MAQWVKNLPAVQETQEMQVQSLGQEDPLEKNMAINSTILFFFFILIFMFFHFPMSGVLVSVTQNGRENWNCNERRLFFFISTDQ